MKLSEFKIGQPFYMDERKWLCTDIGTRTVSAICISSAEIKSNGKRKTLTETELREAGWTNGPPYALHEELLDEYDIVDCGLQLRAGSQQFSNGPRSLHRKTSTAGSA